MKVSLNWAQYYSNVDLTKIGKVKLLEKIGSQLGAIEEVIEWGPRYKGIVIVKVISCEKHPNADKLHVCKIDDGKVIKHVPRDEKGLVQVVCGAPNVHAGMFAVWLPSGVTVPSTIDKEPLVLEARDIRGQISNGMLASAAELGLSDDHSGIMDVDVAQLAEGTKAGTPLTKALRLEDELVIDIENKMFTHRPDLFGILGVARELAGITGQAFDSPAWYGAAPKLNKAGPSLPLVIKNTLPKLVPRFTAIALRINHNDSSPLWLQSYLSRVGSRPINTVVDITNYFMQLTGQPLHAYDYDKLLALQAGVRSKKQGVSIETRMSKKGEKLKLLNGKEVTFEDGSTLLITSGGVPVGIGGVMGGAETEVDENTKNIILECANFDMYNLRRTAMKYGLFTDAVTRFTKGQSSLQQDKVITKAAQDVMRLAGGKVVSELIDKHVPLTSPRSVRVTPNFINERLGLKLSAKKMTELLENVEFKVLQAGRQLGITPPFWRTDIHIPEDIVEEIGRLYGYDHLPLELPKHDIAPAPKDPDSELKNQLRNTLARAGANEVLTYSFIHGDLFTKVGQNKKHAFQLANAISPELQYYRLSLTPSLLEKVHMNVKSGYSEFAIFELNKVHYKDEWDEEEPNIPLEDNHLALIITFAARQQPAGAAYFQARHYVGQIAPELVSRLVPLEEFDLNKDEWGQQLTAPYEPKHAAVIVKDDLIWGVIGEFRADVRRSLKLPDYSAGFEINLGIFAREQPHYQPLPRFPKVEQDITLKAPAKLSYQTLQMLLSEKLEALRPSQTLASFTPIDIYQSEPSYRHFSWRLSIASYERTLTDAEINTLLDEIAAAAAETYGAVRL